VCAHARLKKWWYRQLIPTPAIPGLLVITPQPLVLNARQDHNFRGSESLKAAGPHASPSLAVRGEELGNGWGKVPRVLISKFAYANAIGCCGDLV
jgi:hypothetical protein